jgi:hypothetical protein
MRSKALYLLAGLLVTFCFAKVSFAMDLGDPMIQELKDMLAKGQCQQLEADDESVPCNNHCYFKKFPVSKLNCLKASESNRPMIKEGRTCRGVSQAEIASGSEDNEYLIKKTSAGDELNPPPAKCSNCKVWGKSPWGRIEGCEVRMYWKEAYLCKKEEGPNESPSKDTIRGNNGFVLGDYSKASKSDKKHDARLGYYYYISAHGAEVKQTCGGSETWKKSSK